MILFYDTCSLLSAQQTAFQQENKFYISSITLNELENIKTSGTKDEETKYASRKILHLLEENEDKYEVILYKESYSEDITKFNLPNTPDSKIVITAYHLFKTLNDDCLFLTEDLACKAIAHAIGLPVQFHKQEEDNYTGYLEKELTNLELADFYSDILPYHKNIYNLLDNQYLIIRNEENHIIDKYKWKGDEYLPVTFQKAESKMFGKVTPKNGDIYQQLALDSLANNQFTVIKGPAGSGKDFLGLGYLFSLLEREKINKIYIFVNPVATRGAAKLGYLPGDKNSKILDSQIGNFLIGKLGDMEIVYQLIEKGLLVLMPVSDIRGVDLSGQKAALYITEGQNMSIDLMKLALQRVGNDTLVIINGDIDCQVDSSYYAGNNNGLRKTCEIFKGEDYFGCVTLQKCYRSNIAEKAIEM